MNIIGIINNSFPLKTLTTLAIAESIAFVLVIKLNAPPTTNKNAIISADCSIPFTGACITWNNPCASFSTYVNESFKTTVLVCPLTSVATLSYAPPGTIYVAIAIKIIIEKIITNVCGIFIPPLNFFQKPCLSLPDTFCIILKSPYL